MHCYEGCTQVYQPYSGRNESYETYLPSDAAFPQRCFKPAQQIETKHDDLLVVLGGCVLLWTDLNRKLSEVSGLGEADETACTSRLVMERVKWALWKEDEAREYIDDFQRYKTSLTLMLTIIQW